MWSKGAVLRRSWRHLGPFQTLESSHLFTSMPTPNEVKGNRTDVEWTSAKPYESIPGPGLFDVIRWFLPGGDLYNQPFYNLLYQMNDKYGKVSRFPSMFGRPEMVFTFDPNLSQQIYSVEGVWPNRRGVETFDYYRTKVRPDVFKGMGGLVSDQDEKWHKMRSKVNPVMMQPRSVKSYMDPVDVVTREFVQKIGMLRDKNDEMPPDFKTEMGAWALESIGVIALDRRLGALAFKREPDVEQLIQATKNFAKLTYKLEFEPSLWRYVSTNTFRQLMATFDVMTKLVMKYVDSAIADLEKQGTAGSKGEESVLQKLLQIDRSYAIIMTFDMLFAGIDTTSNAVVNLLYLLAKNPDKQDKLRAEIFNLLPNVDSKFTEYSLDHSPYFRGALKESMRLLPLNPGNLRGAGQDIVLNGYQIPKNTDVFMGNMVMHNSDKYFSKSDEFQPERFIRDEHGNYPPSPPDYSPFTFLPFGFGTRMCVGKRFAELEAQLLTFRILREYRVEWHHEPMKFASGIIVTASSPLRFKMVRLDK